MYIDETTEIRDPKVFTKIIADIKDPENITRKSEAYTDYLIWKDYQINLIKDRLVKDFPKTGDSFRRISIPICKKIISKLARLYDRGAQRVILQNDTPNEIYQNYIDPIYEEMRINMCMSKSNKLFLLHNQSMLFVYPQGENIYIRVLPPFLFDVIADGNNEEPQLIITSHFTEASNWVPVDPTVNRREETIEGEPEDTRINRRVFNFWSKNFHFVVIEEKDKTGKYKYYIDPEFMAQNPQLINPIGKLPFVDIKQDTDGYYWPFRNNLAEETLEVNLMLSDIATIARDQGFGIPVVIGDEIPSELTVGTRNLIRLETTPATKIPPSFSFASANPDLGGYMNMILGIVRMLLTSNNLTPRQVSSEEYSSNYLSGIAMLIDQADVFEENEANKQYFIDAEKELLDLIVRYNNLMVQTRQKQGTMLPDNLDLKITYPDPQAITGEAQKLEILMQKEELGLLLPYEKHQLMNPDLTPEEAQQREDEIREHKQAKLEQFMKPPKQEEEEENA